MKRFLVLVLSALCFCALFAACDGQGDNSQGKDNNNQNQHIGIVDVCEVVFKQDGFDDIVKTVSAGETLTDIPTPVQTGETGYTVVWDRTDFSNITENA